MHRFAVALVSLLAALGVTAGCSDPSSYRGGPPPGDDAGAPDSTDLASASASHDLAGAPPRDLAMTMANADLAATPITGSVGPTGGTVSRLFFGFTGDARPSQCNEHTDYPTAIVDSIYTHLASAGVQFNVDLGDHMFVCQNGSQSEATTQMNLYTTGAAHLPKPTFYVLGNHDCVSMTNPSYCGVNGFSTVNYVAFLNALAKEGIGGGSPYYSFNVSTQNGTASFIMIADNAWSTAQQSWLQSTLAAADAGSKYIFIFRHHPLDNTDWPAFPTITQMIKTVKHRTITFTGHDHEFRVDTYNDPSGRTLIVGNGGAPLAQNFTWYGYGTVEQLQTGALEVRTFDQSNGNQMSAFTISPQ